jgi:hypothetical protein
VFVTTTSLAPDVLDVVKPVMLVELTTVIPLNGAEPIETVAADRKPVPVKVTAVPPPRAPLAGEIEEIVGAPW